MAEDVVVHVPMSPELYERLMLFASGGPKPTPVPTLVRLMCDAACEQDEARRAVLQRELCTVIGALGDG